MCQVTYSQILSENGVKSINLRNSNSKVSLSSKKTGEFLKIQLNIPNDYEFKRQIIPGTKDKIVKERKRGYLSSKNIFPLFVCNL